MLKTDSHYNELLFSFTDLRIGCHFDFFRNMICVAKTFKAFFCQNLEEQDSILKLVIAGMQV
jgi:hypothetical protein